MEKRKTKKQLAEENQKLIDSYDYLSNAVSTMDCTGLIPSAPKTTAELDSYEEKLCMHASYTKRCKLYDKIRKVGSAEVGKLIDQCLDTEID